MTEEVTEETAAERTKELTFEETLKKLEGVVERLETVSSLTLDEALEAFEEGVHLTRSCRKMLDDAQLRVNELIGEEENQTDSARPEAGNNQPAIEDDIPF